jgi:predicted alpha/beta hydrolase
VEFVEIALRAADGYRLGATLYRPDAANGCALQVNAAAGVRQEYYAKFAAYFAARGFSVLTFDYRGVGRSRYADVRSATARLADWAELDASAALEFLLGEGLRVMAACHSFGGASLGLVRGAERFAAAFAVGSQSCYWRHWHGAWRPGMWLLTRALLPAATRLCGYFPGALLGQGENLPAGVALDWAAACREPDYLAAAPAARERFARLRVPLRLYSVTDDVYAPPAAVDALARLYPGAASEVKRIAPAELGEDSLGHFGFFRERFRDTLWRDAHDWLIRCRHA